METVPLVSRRVDLNCDMGESYGVWSLGSDREMMEHITSASIACGFHAGDPTIMRKTVRLARERGVSVGAHPGYPDLPGFGRRPMSLPLPELVDVLVYQIGALQAIARAEGTRVTYVKVHGALYNQAETDPRLAAAVVEALGLTGGGEPLPLVASPVSAMAEAAALAGARLVGEAFADRAYTREGRLVPRSRPGAVILDPELVASRVSEMVRGGVLIAEEGERIPATFETICIHGDTPNAPALAGAVRRAIEAAGVEVGSFA